MTGSPTPVKALRAIHSNDLRLCPVARSPVDNLAQSVDGGHSLRLHPGRPPPGPGCPPPPYNGGHAPRTPRSASHCPPFEFPPKPENRQGLGVGHGQPQAVAHPRHRRTRARNPSGWVTEAAGARCAKARQGAQPWGSGGASPLPGSALGAAGTAQAKRAGGPWTPPSGGLFTPKGRTTLL